MAKYYVDETGKFLGAFDGYQSPVLDEETGAVIEFETIMPEIPAGAIEVNSWPDDGRQVWNGRGWGPAPQDDQQQDRVAVLEAALKSAGVLTDAQLDTAATLEVSKA